MMHTVYLNQTENAGKHVKWSIIDYFFVFQNDDSRRPIFIFFYFRRCTNGTFHCRENLFFKIQDPFLRIFN